MNAFVRVIAYSWPGARPGSKVWNGLFYTVREHPFKSASLSDCDYSVDFSKFTFNETDRVSVIATKPLTSNENWVEFSPGDLILFDNGIPHTTSEDCFHSELIGHGLQSDVLKAPALEEDMRRFRINKSTFIGADI